MKKTFRLFFCALLLSTFSCNTAYAAELEEGKPRVSRMKSAWRSFKTKATSFFSKVKKSKRRTQPVKAQEMTAAVVAVRSQKTASKGSPSAMERRSVSHASIHHSSSVSPLQGAGEGERIASTVSLDTQAPGLPTTASVTHAQHSSGQQNRERSTVVTIRRGEEGQSGDTQSWGQGTQDNALRGESQATGDGTGESLKNPEVEEEVDWVTIFDATGKLLRMTGVEKTLSEEMDAMAGRVSSLWKSEQIKSLVGVEDSLRHVHSFEQYMQDELIGRIMGRDGPVKSLAGLVVQDGLPAAVQFGIGHIPIPGASKVAEAVGDAFETGMEHLTGVHLKHGTAHSILEAAYLSNAVATSFNRVYAPILEELTPDERSDLMRHAVDTAMFYIDREVLENPNATINPADVMASIGREFLDLDARVPRFGILMRKMKRALFGKSGLDVEDSRFLLTSTPIRVGENPLLHGPLEDPHDPRSPLVTLFWKGTMEKDAPIEAPKGMREGLANLSRVVTLEEAQRLGLNKALGDVTQQSVAMSLAPEVI